MRRLLACLALGLMTSAAAADVREDSRFGPLHLTAPRTEARGFVILFSDVGGWNASTEAAAQVLARQGAFVAGVDFREYRARFEQRNDPCYSLAGDAENLSLETQRALGYRGYHTPILAGFGEGGSLAGVILSETLPATLSAAVALDPSVFVETAKPLCTKASAISAAGHGFTYGSPGALPGAWIVGFSASSPEDRKAHIETLKQAGAPVEIKAVPKDDQPGEALAALLLPRLDNGTAPGSLARLPLIELPAVNGSPLLAIIVSGDGGWRDLDKSIAESLSREGVSVIGWDSLRYFWNGKTPEETSRDLALVIEAYKAKWHAAKIALIGYSFGADILPFAYDELPSADKASVVQLSLLGLTAAADFEIRVAGWLGQQAGKDALPVDPVLARIDPALVQCFYGQNEHDSICPGLAARGTEVVRTPGGHHFGRDYAALARAVLEGFRRRAKEPA